MLALALQASPVAAQDPADGADPAPFFGLSLGAKGIGGADVWANPANHDDRITYEIAGNETTGIDVISSSSMDFRLLLGVAFEHGFRG